MLCNTIRSLSYKICSLRQEFYMRGFFAANFEKNVDNLLGLK